MARVIFAPQAEQDLRDVWLYIAMTNLSAADRWLDETRDTCGMLAGIPLAGRERDDLQKGLRGLPTGNYVILYRMAGEALVEIVRVLHGARDLGALLE